MGYYVDATVLYTVFFCCCCEKLCYVPFYFHDKLILFSGGVALKRGDDGRASGGRRVFCSVQSSPPPAWPGRAVPELGYKTWEGQKPISIVGSTGSIGTQVLLSLKSGPYYIGNICVFNAMKHGQGNNLKK